MKLIVYDVETTGLIAESDRIVEFGATLLDSGKEVASYNWIIRPYRTSCFVPAGAEKIHGISKQMIEKDGVLFSTIGKQLQDILENADVHCAFNETFDRGFMKCALEGIGLNFPVRPVIDPIRIAYRFIPYDVLRKKRLIDLCNFCGITLEDAHRAEHDARATAKLLLKMCDELEVSLEDLLMDSPSKLLGKFHLQQPHLDPIVALYSGLPKKIYK
jgi:DNA polymerase III epsilon subunit-like protein